MSDMIYIEFLTGSVEFAPAPPGYTRMITKDGDGRVINDVTSHTVCLGETHCIFCGRELIATD